MSRTSFRALGIALALCALAFVAWRSFAPPTPRLSDASLESRQPTSPEGDRSSTLLLGAPVPLPPPGTAAVDARAAAFVAAVGAKTYTFHVVADEEGTPVGDATFETRVGTLLGKTDAEGKLSVRFRVPPVLGATEVIVRRPGFAVELVAPRPEEITVVRLTRGLPIRGRVLLEATGAPVAGARVTDLHAVGVRLEGEVTTDADGRFRVEDARPLEPVELGVRAPGRATVTVQATPTPSSAELLVLLPEGATLSGWVRDVSGRPLPGVPIFLHHDTTALHVSRVSPRPGDPVEQTSTDASGRYELTGIAVGETLIAVAQPRPMLVAASEPFTFESPRDRILRNLEVPRGGTLEVTVAGPPAGYEAAVQLGGPGVQATDVDGETRSEASWAFQDITPGRYTVHLVAEGYPLREEEIDVTPGLVAHVVFSYPGSLLVRGRVSYPDGRPAVGARVWWEGGTSAEAEADELGGFQFGGLDATPGRLVVESPDAWFASSSLDGVPPGGPLVRVVFAPLPFVRLRPEGLPVGTAVTAWVEPPVRDVRLSVGADGVLEVRLRSVGQAGSIMWVAEGFSPLLTEVPPLAEGAVLDLGARRFEKGRSVALRIVDEAGRPVRGAVVRHASIWGEKRTPVTSDAWGDALLVHMPRFPTLLWVRVEGAGSDRLWVPADTAGPVVLRLGVTGTLELRVTDRDGCPAAQASVELLPTERDPFDVTPGVGGRTDDVGTLTLPVQEGAHQVWVSPAGREGETTSGPVVVRAGETTTFEIRLP